MNQYVKEPIEKINQMIEERKNWSDLMYVLNPKELLNTADLIEASGFKTLEVADQFRENYKKLTLK